MRYNAIVERWRLLLIIFILIGIGISFLFRLSTNVGYAPEQPLPFSHKIHAGDNHIECLYCHNAAETSRHATIPAIGTCMGCHAVVAINKATIKSLKETYDRGEVYRWVRIYELPDFVYFAHSQHVRAGVACQVCHGPVQTMNRMMQVNRLEMGDCVSCHRKTNYTPDENPPVSKPGFQADRGGNVYPQYFNYFVFSDSTMRNRRQYLGVGYVTAVGKLQNAPDNCSTCHQ